MNDRLAEQLRAALNAARKDRDQHRTLLYSTILSDIRNREIDAKHALEDAEVVDVLRRGIKKRHESVDAFKAGGRADAAEKEQFEITELEKYLPPAVPDEEIRAAVRTAIAEGAQDLGKLMGAVMPQFKGRAEGKDVNRIAREELAATS